MTTYYVKPTGDNGLDGLSEANAWQTITYALTQMIAYDVLNIMAGAYPEDVYISTEHITLTGAGSGSVTVNSLHLDASYPNCSGMSVSGGVETSGAVITHVTLDDVITGVASAFAYANNAIITNCDFNGLLFCYQADATSVSNTILRNNASESLQALCFTAGDGLNATFENITVMGAPIANKSILIASGTNTTFTNTTFEYPENAIVVTGGTATFIQNNRKTFIGTTGTNTVTPTESTLVVAAGTYDYRDFVITPDASITIPETSLWETSGDQNKTWKVEATGSRTITFQLGDMLPSTRYDLKVEGVKVSDAVSDALGVITFSAYTGSFSTKTFTTEKSADQSIGVRFF